MHLPCLFVPLRKPDPRPNSIGGRPGRSRAMRPQSMPPGRSPQEINSLAIGHDEEAEPIPVDSRVDLERIRRAVREILIAVGEDPDREGLLETPDRVARMYAEVFRGLHQDPSAHLSKVFTQKYDEMVL